MVLTKLLVFRIRSLVLFFFILYLSLNCFIFSSTRKFVVLVILFLCYPPRILTYFYRFGTSPVDYTFPPFTFFFIFLLCLFSFLIPLFYYWFPLLVSSKLYTY